MTDGAEEVKIENQDNNSESAMPKLRESKKQLYKLRRNAKLWKHPELLRKKWFKKSWYLSDAVIELKMGHSIVMLIVGRTRLGKTWTALTLGCLFSDKFIYNPIRWVSFKDYARDILNEIVANGYEGLKHDIYILDECGKDLDYREYASGFNRLFSHILQTQQIANKIFILILPDANLLAKAHHKLINSMFWKKSRNVVEIDKIISRPTDIVGKKTYVMKIETIVGFPLPHPDVIKWFETIEQPQKQDIAKDLLKSLDKIEKDMDNPGRVFYKSLFGDG